ncbi:hypothetical protein HSR122_1585 [Halapricum desulfuricans]|uniref:Uncharacterized protein n=1 Tax=Halapricum desulfuricans TaxID=2841257 RepID=A0A897NF23_9EURY|nr:hypothetical protein HSR122_1585 [Halapricum desulfuricans]
MGTVVHDNLEGTDVIGEYPEDHSPIDGECETGDELDTTQVRDDGQVQHCDISRRRK